MTPSKTSLSTTPQMAKLPCRSARDGNVWMNQSQLAELFATSVPNISTHISKILKDKELDKNSVVKDYLTTAADVAIAKKKLGREAP